MGGLDSLANNWAIAVELAIAIIGLYFTGISIRSDARARRVANLLTITANHREIWKEFSRRPELVRVLDASADVESDPVTRGEAEFVNLVVLHVSSVHYALKDNVVIELEGLRRDVGEFFALPVPRAVWEEVKQFQNKDLVTFVEASNTRDHQKT